MILMKKLMGNMSKEELTYRNMYGDWKDHVQETKFIKEESPMEIEQISCWRCEDGTIFEDADEALQHVKHLRFIKFMCEKLHICGECAENLYTERDTLISFLLKEEYII